MKRLFLDTSVLFAATLSSTGASREIFRLALNDELALVLSDYVLMEMRQALARKALTSLPALEDFLNRLRLRNGQTLQKRRACSGPIYRAEGCSSRCSDNQGQRREPRESG